MLGIAIAIAIFLAALVVSWKNPRRGMLLCIAMLPWNGLEFDLGIRVNVYTMILLALIPPLFLKTRQRIGALTDEKAFQAFFLFTSFVVTWSLLQIFVVPEAQVAGGVLRSPTIRAALQILVFLLSISPLWLAPLIFRSGDDLMAAARVYVVSCYALAALGFVQIGVWYATGNDPLPIGILNQLVGGVNADRTRSGIFVFEGNDLYRMSSLGGEPKGLGQSLVVAAFMLQAQYVFARRALTSRKLAAWCFLILAVFATQSTSAFGLLALSLLITAVAYFMASGKKSSAASLSTVALVASLAGCLILSGMVFGEQQIERVSTWTTNLLSERTVGRGSILEDFDQAIVGFLKDHPLNMLLGVGLGNIHLYADAYLPSVTRHYAGGAVFFAKSGYLKYLSESGIIGLSLFLLACGSLYMRLNYWAKRARPFIRVESWVPQLKLCFLYLAIAFLARVYTGAHFFMAAGLVCATCGVLAAQLRMLGVQETAAFARTGWAPSRVQVNDPALGMPGFRR